MIQIITLTIDRAIDISTSVGRFISSSANLREFCKLTGVRGSDEAGSIEAGRDLIDKALVSSIALTFGIAAAMLITRDDVLRAEALSIQWQALLAR